MHIVLGGTGQVGSGVVGALLAEGEPVTVVTRDASHGAHWEERGAEVAVVDVGEVEQLRSVLRRGSRAFLLNPSADPGGDTDAEERRTAASIASAVEGSDLEKVVLASTYGARPGERIGDLSVLHELEQLLLAGTVPVAVNRGAYYLSNWAGMAGSVQADGVLPSFFPVDFELPMVAPADLGAAAARRLLAPVEDTGVRHVEGPERYTPGDVARAFADALGRPVEVAVVGPGEWESTFLQMGFSPEAAASYARMTEVSQGTDLELPPDPERGTTTLEDFIGQVVA